MAPRLTIRWLIVYTALLSGAALADGVPLFALGERLPAAELAKMPWADSVTTVAIDSRALRSDVITAELAGKQYRFVGRRVTNESSVLWTGTAPEGSATLTEGHLGVVGQLYVGGKLFVLSPVNGRVMLLQPKPRTDPFCYDEPSPEVIERIRSAMSDPRGATDTVIPPDLPLPPGAKTDRPIPSVVIDQRPR